MSEWKDYRVKDIAKQIGSGTTPSRSVERYYDSEDYHWINSGDFNDSEVYGGKQMISESAIAESSALRFYMPDTVLVAMYGASIGKVGMLKVKATVNQACCAIVPNTKLILPYFLFYLFVNDKDALISKSFGGTQPNVSQGIIANMLFCIPSVSVQQKIVDYLDAKTSAIDTQINLFEKKKDAYTRLKKAMINRAVTRGLDEHVKLKDSVVKWIGMIPEHWEMKRLKDISELNPQYKGDGKEEIVSYLPMEGLRLDALEMQDITLAEGKGKYTFFEDGDLLVAKVTPCFENGNIAIAQKLNNGIGFGSSEIFVLRTKKDVSARYMFYYVQTSSFQDEACTTMCGVGGLKRISPLFMRQRIVFLPPFDEQKNITAYLDDKCSKINAAIANIDKQVDALKRLKRSLINEVITGQRNVE